MSERWPFCFDVDDVEIHDYPTVIDVKDVIPGNAGNALPGSNAALHGVRVVHTPTGVEMSMGSYGSRDANTGAALRRLDRLVRRELLDGPR